LLLFLGLVWGRALTTPCEATSADWCIFGAFSVHFWSIFGAFLVHFWSIFGAFFPLRKTFTKIRISTKNNFKESQL
jgi:hypothetical protein